MGTILIEQAICTIVIGQPDGGVVLLPENENSTVIQIAEPGQKGDPGESGSAVIEYPAGESLGGHRIVRLDQTGHVYYADNRTLSHGWTIIGITTGAVAMGDVATIRTTGELIEPTWSWTPTLPVFVGENGLPTQSPPTGTATFIAIVGVATNPTTLLLNIETPIELS